MKITVINGTEKKGVTYRLKEIFLERFKNTAEITEFYLPKDMPDFCNGCAVCCLKGENLCKDNGYSAHIWAAIENADLLVFTSPAYVMHTTGAMKNLLDHFAYHWMPHRPSPALFGKRAVIITQCLGAGAKSTANDIKDSLSWWGISRISVFTARLMNGILCDELPAKKKIKLERKLKKLSAKCAGVDYRKPARTGIKARFKFYMCRALQRRLRKSNPEYTDAAYWAERGWLNGARPWKK